MGKKKTLLVILVMTILLSGCQKQSRLLTYFDDFTLLGLTGQHQIVESDRWISPEGKISGSSFFGFGHFEGSLSSEVKLSFCWSLYGNQRYITTLPYNKVKFVIDETYEIPMVEFVFSDYWRKATLWEESLHNPETTNLNDILSKYMEFATIRLDQETFSQICFPE